MANLIFEASTQQQVHAFIQNLPQALLITGANGAGLLTTAKYLAGSSLTEVVRPTNRDKEPDPRGMIRIEQIRQLRQHTRGATRQQTVYIIDDADTMNHQTQNAFLKLLEEPAQNVHFILTSHHPELLLPTILSRTEKLQIRPISDEASRLLLSRTAKLDNAATAQVLFLASGQPAALSRLASDNHHLTDVTPIIRDAKQLVSGKTNDQLQIISRYTDRDSTLALLQYSISLVRKSLASSRTQHSAIQLLDRLSATHENIAAGGNVRLQLMALIV